MRTIRMARQRTVGGLATGLVIAAIVATGSAAHADPLTGTPTPSTSSSGSTASSLAAEGDPTDTATTTTTTSESTTTTTTATETATTTPTTPVPTATATRPITPSPVVIAAGTISDRVKDVQVRLRLVKPAYWTYAINGRYGVLLGQSVLAFQRDQRLPLSGVLDQRTWRRLVAVTATRTLLARDSSGNAVKDLQVRLRAAGATYWPYAVNGYFGWTVGQRVSTFQRDQDLPQSGVLDQRTWSRLVALTATPVVLNASSSKANLQELQRRLGAKGLWPYAFSGSYGVTLGQKVLAFQRAYDLPQSGTVDRRTWARLVALTYTAGTFDKHRYYSGLRPLMPTLSSLDQRCRTGRVMCVDKSTRTLTWVVDGKPLMVMWARFGGPGRETREGTFRVSRMYEYVISNLYFTPMPYSMFFSGGQAVHYSSNFARIGYAGSSHGCVNIADLAQVKSLFFKVRVGDKVVVHP
ncbi:L,D-transpeptidase family protein [Terrabacter sp. C0L_2]|uniref:L,D-transpeptidase family protein n=1 Tax=Terrabacter sp. C0L_2 TaxID=3108389 RepID=UPI002ECFCA86|nr:L,D-transpeptidase family protein [Terrabacter sp. C0L_2]